MSETRWVPVSAAQIRLLRSAAEIIKSHGRYGHCEGPKDPGKGVRQIALLDSLAVSYENGITEGEAQAAADDSIPALPHRARDAARAKFLAAFREDS